MATEDDQGDGAGKYTAGVLRIIAGIILFPVLWLGVMFNFLELAERFSFIPGISRKGGLVSGVVAMLVTALILGVVVGGTAASGGIPEVGDGGDDAVTPTPKPTPTLTATATPTATPVPTPAYTNTPTQTDVQRNLSGLEGFEEDFRNRLNKTVEEDDVRGVPTLATEYRMTDDEKRELWLVYWECDRVDPLQVQRLNIANAYVGTAGTVSGEKPAKLRVYGVTNLENFTDTITHINTSSARDAYNGSVSSGTFNENWYQRQREPTESEFEIAYQMVKSESGEQKAKNAFHEHHSQINGCPNDAELASEGS